MIALVKRAPGEHAEVAAHYGLVELAPIMARCFHKLKSVKEAGRDWLLKFPEHAVHALIAPALGTRGEAQECASAALRMLNGKGYHDLILEAAALYRNSEVPAAVEEMLNESELDLFPAKVPSPPSWWQPGAWRTPIVAEGSEKGKALPARALDHIGAMLAFPSDEGWYAGIEEVKALCTKDSLAMFAWDMFSTWLNSGASSKEKWGFLALGLFGNDNTARKLTPYTGLCRHKVTLIPAYQEWAGRPDSAGPDAAEAEESGAQAEVGWSPADFTDERIEQSFKKSVIRQAAELLKTQPTIRLLSGTVDAAGPTAYLPMSTVRFFSSRNLAHAHCDCVDGGGCAHVVLAIWAFREAGLTANESERTLSLGRSDQPGGRNLFDAKAERCAAAIGELLGQIWAEGASQPSIALEGKIAEAEIPAEHLKWRWISEGVGDLRLMLQAYHHRSSRFSGVELMTLMAFLQARLEAARHAEIAGEIPAHQILGLGVTGEAALDRLTLIGLGAELWEDTDREGASCYFVDPDTMTLMVLERDYSKKEDGRHILSQRLAGLSLQKIAQSQIVTRGAKRKANGLVSIAAEARLTNALPLSARSWKNIGPPLRYGRGRDLLRYRQSRPPEFVQPRQALSQLAILPVSEVQEWGWEAGAQKLLALVGSRPLNDAGDPPDEADLFKLELPYRKIDGRSVDNLAQHLERGDITEICGLATIESGSLTMLPLALTTAQEMVVLAAHDAEDRPLPHHDFSFGEKSDPHRALDNLRDLLTRSLIGGLRHRNPKMGDDLREIKGNLAQLGLPACSGQVGELEYFLERGDRLESARTLGRLGLLLHQLRQEVL